MVVNLDRVLFAYAPNDNRYYEPIERSDFVDLEAECFACSA
jgi:hypothetical protein